MGPRKILCVSSIIIDVAKFLSSVSGASQYLYSFAQNPLACCTPSDFIPGRSNTYMRYFNSLWHGDTLIFHICTLQYLYAFYQHPLTRRWSHLSYLVAPILVSATPTPLDFLLLYNQNIDQLTIPEVAEDDYHLYICSGSNPCLHYLDTFWNG